jgi:hypothetical protein
MRILCGHSIGELTCLNNKGFPADRLKPDPGLGINPELGDALMMAIPVAGELQILKATIKGGVYTLRDPETGVVMRTGRTRNLAKRERDHARDSELAHLEFNVEYRTDSYAEQRGLEHVIYSRYPGAQKVNGGFNKIRPIDPANKNMDRYDYLRWLESSGKG